METVGPVLDFLKFGGDPETGGKGAGHNPWKNYTARGDSINWLEPKRSKVAESQLPLGLEPRICSSQCVSKLSDSSTGALTVLRPISKIEKWVVAQFLEISAPSPKNSWSNPPTHSVQFSSVTQSVSRVWVFATPWTAALQVSLSITNSLSLLRLMSIESMMPSNHLILSRPLLLPPSIFPSIRESFPLISL